MCAEAPPFGALFWVDNDPEWDSIVKKVEEENNILVYHITHENTEFGEMLTMLYVSSHEEEWEMDFEDLCDTYEGSHYVYAYVYNLTDPQLSEFGRVGIKEAGGGLIRTAQTIT